jgi:hypothetical protein
MGSGEVLHPVACALESAKCAFGQPSADNWIHDRPTSRVAPTGMLAGRSRLLLSPNGESRQAARANADVRIRRC